VVRSRDKGASGEREAAHALSVAFGFERARRAQQHSGTETSADLVVPETPTLWYEVKRVQRLCVPATMDTAARQCGDKLPLLVHRRNGGEWLVTMRLKDGPQVAAALMEGMDAARQYARERCGF